MIYSIIFIGLAYGYIASRGQFCMNSGFSNVTRHGDTSKLRAYIGAVLIQAACLLIYILIAPVTGMDSPNIPALPGLFWVGNIVGGFIFGIAMYFAGGCAAGIFYKLGEKKIQALFPILGLIVGVVLTQTYIMPKLLSAGMSAGEQIITTSSGARIVTLLIILVLLFTLFNSSNSVPGGARWSWKQTSVYMGAAAFIAWLLAIHAGQGFSMAVLPAANDWSAGKAITWSSLFVVSIPIGSLLANLESPTGSWPKPKRMLRLGLGGLGLGAGGTMALGCTVGHGLAFAPLLVPASLITIVSIFLGSALVGLFTRR